MNGIDMTGFKEAMDLISKLEIDSSLEKELLNECKTIINPVREASPVDSGDTKRGWKISIRGNKAILSNVKWQYIYPEFGSIHGRQHVGQIRKAISEHLTDISKAMLNKISSKAGV